MKFISRLIAFFLIVFSPAAVFAADSGDHFWQVHPPQQNGNGSYNVSATRRDIHNGTARDVTSSVTNHTPSRSATAASMAKRLARGGVGALAVSVALTAILGGVDYLLDPDNNRVVLTYPGLNTPDGRPVSDYDWLSTQTSVWMPSPDCNVAPVPSGATRTGGYFVDENDPSTGWETNYICTYTKDGVSGTYDNIRGYPSGNRVDPPQPAPDIHINVPLNNILGDVFDAAAGNPHGDYSTAANAGANADANTGNDVKKPAATGTTTAASNAVTNVLVRNSAETARGDNPAVDELDAALSASLDQTVQETGKTGTSDATTTTTTDTNGDAVPDETGTSTTTTEFELPYFCDFAAIVCDAIDYFKNFFKTDNPPVNPDGKITPVPGTLEDNGLDTSVIDQQRVDFGAACPADIRIPIHVGSGSGDIVLPWTPICEFASMLRPFIIAMAYLSGAFIVLGIGKGD